MAAGTPPNRPTSPDPRRACRRASTGQGARRLPGCARHRSPPCHLRAATLAQAINEVQARLAVGAERREHAGGEDQVGQQSGAGQGGGAAAGDAPDRQFRDPECPGDRAGVSSTVGDRSAGPRSRSAVAGRVDADQPQAFLAGLAQRGRGQLPGAWAAAKDEDGQPARPARVLDHELAARHLDRDVSDAGHGLMLAGSLAGDRVGFSSAGS